LQIKWDYKQNKIFRAREQAKQQTGVKQVASRALLAVFLFGFLLSGPEDGGDTVHFQSTTWHYVPEDKTFQATFYFIILSHKSYTGMLLQNVIWYQNL
jgi:hypothetical protein